MGEYRHVWRIAFKNFIDSFRPRPIKGNVIGKDYLGNQYFEIPPDPQRGKRNPTRWFDPPKQKDFENPMPAEWEAWLRLRRKEPPSEDEIAHNLAIMEMKKVNAAKIEEKRLAEGGSLPTKPTRGQESFPTYSEFKPGDPERQ